MGTRESKVWKNPFLMAVEYFVTAINNEIVAIFFICENIIHILDKLFVVDTVELIHWVSFLLSFICHWEDSPGIYFSDFTNNWEGIIW